jgi:hypothetical protein
MVRERADRLLNDLLDAATLGAFDSGPVSGDEIEAETKSGDGNARRRATSAAQA